MWDSREQLTHVHTHTHRHINSSQGLIDAHTHTHTHVHTHTHTHTSAVGMVSSPHMVTPCAHGWQRTSAMCMCLSMCACLCVSVSVQIWRVRCMVRRTEHIQAPNNACTHTGISVIFQSPAPISVRVCMDTHAAMCVCMHAPFHVCVCVCVYTGWQRVTLSSSTRYQQQR